jgi:hypothetical protein
VRIHLEFSPEQGHLQRVRLEYAFALFCAIYRHEKVATRQAGSADMRIVYGPSSRQSCSQPTLELGNLYRPRSIREPAPPPKQFERNARSTVLFYSPIAGAEPDWLAEIFEWVSCADEYSIVGRDAQGRIDFRDSYIGRNRLDLSVPYAAVAMRFLEEALCQHLPGYPTGRRSQMAGTSHLVVNTHDVDILPAGYFRSLYRLAKYSLISLLVFNSAASAAVQAGKALSMAMGGPNPLDQSPQLLRGEVSKGVGATYFLIARQRHRRDANYRIDDPTVRELMHTIERQGMEVALHGSYNSLDEPGGLTAEFKQLRAEGFRPRGNRQHWLRFTLDRLIPAVEQSGALYDTSVGWDHSGFRAGACFAFPPYNFASEKASTFLEIPLAVMEIGLVSAGTPPADWFDRVARVLSNSRQYGPGGISLLWHPTAFGAGQLPREIERIFWKLIEQRSDWNDRWVSALDFVRLESERYIKVGLLPPEYGSDIVAPAECALRSNVG